jgi:uncharacterized membrane protein
MAETGRLGPPDGGQPVDPVSGPAPRAGASDGPSMPPPSTVAAPRPVRRWLWLGLRDFAAMPLTSLFYGLAFVAMAFVLERYMRDGAWMLALVTGFALVAPFLAIGLYALSRDRCRGGAAGDPAGASFLASLTAWRTNFGQVAIYGVILTLLLAAWIRVSVVLVALFFDQPATSLSELAVGLAQDPEGFVFFAVYFVVGGAFACLVFATGVVALPMMLDRPVDVVSAMIWSAQAALANVATMLRWAAAIATLLALGMLGRFLPLALIVPVIGHASWHVYRELSGGTAGEGAQDGPPESPSPV